ncbi:hypothetical protein KIPB_011768, partial [Kipferlia bialata]|eukprot:g11768.t1
MQQNIRLQGLRYLQKRNVDTADLQRSLAQASEALTAERVETHALPLSRAMPAGAEESTTSVVELASRRSQSLFDDFSQASLASIKTSLRMPLSQTSTLGQSLTVGPSMTSTRRLSNRPPRAGGVAPALTPEHRRLIAAIENNHDSVTRLCAALRGTPQRYASLDEHAHQHTGSGRRPRLAGAAMDLLDLVEVMH